MNWHTTQVKNMFDEIFDDGIFNEIIDAINVNPSRVSTSANPNPLLPAWNAVQSIYENVMIPIGIGLMIIWFLTKFMEKATAEQLTLEQAFMLFAKIIIAFFLITNGLDLFAKLWSFGMAAINELVTGFRDLNAKDVSIDLSALYKSLTGKKYGSNMNIVTALLCMGKLLVPWLVSKVVIACVYFISYSRLIEMMIRILGAPIALSDFMAEGLNGAGWRYLKTFLAIALQGTIIVAICCLYPTILGGVFSATKNFWTGFLQYLAFSFASIALMFKSLSLSKELVGAS